MKPPDHFMPMPRGFPNVRVRRKKIGRRFKILIEFDHATECRSAGWITERNQEIRADVLAKKHDDLKAEITARENEWLHKLRTRLFQMINLSQGLMDPELKRLEEAFIQSCYPHGFSSDAELLAFYTIMRGRDSAVDARLVEWTYQEDGGDKLNDYHKYVREMKQHPPGSVRKARLWFLLQHHIQAKQNGWNRRRMFGLMEQALGDKAGSFDSFEAILKKLKLHYGPRGRTDPKPVDPSQGFIIEKWPRLQKFGKCSLSKA